MRHMEREEFMGSLLKNDKKKENKDEEIASGSSGVVRRRVRENQGVMSSHELFFLQL